MTQTLGNYLIERLRSHGVKYFFGNPGTEFTTIIESFATQAATGQTHPQPVMVPHELTAVNMAYGAYLASGQAQAVMVHATIGAANAAAAIVNASRMNIPLLFIAGRTPITESGSVASRDKFIHWAQESYDQAGMFREYVKWDYELRQTDHIDTVLNRAFSIMNTAPKGPVYLILPRERLMENVTPLHQHLKHSQPSAQLGIMSPTQLDDLVELLCMAERPLILTKTLGEDPAAVTLLEQFTERYAIPVYTPDAHYYNISTRHAMFCGYQSNAYYRQADLVLNLGMDVPWCPATDEPGSNDNDNTSRKANCKAKIIHIGADPLFQHIPIRSHRGDAFYIADIKDTLKQLTQLLNGRIAADKLAYRRQIIQESKQQNTTASGTTVDSKVLTAASVAQTIDAIWDENCILVNELNLPVDAIHFDRPGCYFRTGSASGLGWGLGAALGLALAAQDKTIIAVVGDGSYYFANPAVIHWLADRYGLKLLTIILNNQGMKSIQAVTAAHFPQGAAKTQEYYPLTSLEPSPRFEDMVSIYNGKGYCVECYEDLQPVFTDALESVRNTDRHALINVLLTA